MKTTSVSCTILALAASAFPAACATPTFFARHDYTAPGGDWAAVADTNGDNIPTSASA